MNFIALQFTPRLDDPEIWCTHFHPLSDAYTQQWLYVYKYYILTTNRKRTLCIRIWRLIHRHNKIICMLHTILYYYLFCTPYRTIFKYTACLLFDFMHTTNNIITTVWNCRAAIYIYIYIIMIWVARGQTRNWRCASADSRSSAILERRRVLHIYIRIPYNIPIMFEWLKPRSKIDNRSYGSDKYQTVGPNEEYNIILCII